MNRIAHVRIERNAPSEEGVWSLYCEGEFRERYASADSARRAALKLEPDAQELRIDTRDENGRSLSRENISSRTR